ncbi:putative helicase mov-10-B.1 isoform X1 [Bombus terrestris]|uniref:Helicase mov-10-B.1 isoform X1 n=1 Tax=Bombus terrestris TaxID=30195 RepID=A0A9B0C014_BOMTE|nr:putative helicase mov-10-B.1 isoform X1 [Bombus terrestris]
MANEKSKNKRSIVGESTHCTSFGVCKRVPLVKIQFPADLCAVLNKTKPQNVQLYNDYMKLINNLPNIKKIEPEYYLILFKILLYLEEHELCLIAAKHNLENQKLKYVSDSFEITVPTLDEDDPFITVGDTLKIEVKRLKSKYTCNITDIIGKKVYATIRKSSVVSQLLEEQVDIYFLPMNWQIRCCHSVLHIMFEHNLVNSVYPKINTNLYTLPEVDLDWANKSIAKNKEQKIAVNNILNYSAYPAPYILFGPPGTGKTTTLIETIYQIRKQCKSKNILVCTPSNAAADEITNRLLCLLPHKDVFRMYATSKCCNNVDEKIYPNSNFIDDMVLYLPKKIFILKKIVITTLVTCMRLASLKLRNDHFSYIFIDEASQSTELESLIPLMVMNSKNNTEALYAQIVIAGDPYQLGPLIRCTKIQHLLGKSLLERLMECEPYQKVNNKYNSRYITKLIHNYRNQEAIIHTSNNLFYEKDLLCDKKENKHSIISNWTVLSRKTFPILFLVLKGEEVRTPNGSVYNETEITAVTNIIKILMRSKFRNRKIEEEDIGIVTPFKQQKIMFKRSLNLHKLNNIAVGTVEIFQGQEKEIIVLSTVRSQTFKHRGKQHLGFLANLKRFNVALTRAKDLLIIVGNPSILCQDKYWNTLWKYCQKNNAYVAINENLI